MLKRLLSLALVLSLLCSACFAESVDPTMPDFQGMNDFRLLQYTEDQVYSELSYQLGNEDYIIENVKAIYVSQEYIDELAFNFQANIFFGYTLEDLEDEFKNTGFVFTLGENGTTVVQPISDYDDTYDKVIRNIAIGTGVILVCVTVTAVTAGAGLVTTSMIFAAAAKSGSTAALAGMALGGIAAGVVKGYETGDIEQALKAAAVGGSESFKWGAISGATIGGLQKLSAIRKASRALEGAEEYLKGTVQIADDIPNWRQAELRALNKYGGYDQLTFLNGKQVDFGTSGATRPDITRLLGDHLEAIEVKYYNLEDRGCLNKMYSELQREITDRVKNLPKGSTQRIVLDVTGRGYGIETVDKVAAHIWEILNEIYPNIPIDFLGV